MKILAGAVVGFFLFAILDMGLVIALFDRELVSDPAVKITAAIAGLAAIGMTCGWVVKSIANSSARIAGIIACTAIILVTVGNYLLDQSLEPVWFKAAVIIIVVPVLFAVTNTGKSDTRDEPPSPSKKKGETDAEKA